MKEVIYNKIGSNYNNTREADDRIVEHILNLLPQKENNLIADIGAGTGNYSYKIAIKNNFIHALEPSSIMQNQKKEHKNIKWFTGFAENIPFADNRYDSVICILAYHHFNNLDKAFNEMYRILKKSGNLILFSADLNRVGDDCWIKNYFKPFYKKACETLPNINVIKELTESIFCNNFYFLDFKLPDDLRDGFFYSAWKYPEKYLSEDFRKGISIFSALPEDVVRESVSKLRNDLETGIWHNKYKQISEFESYNGGYFFGSIKKG